MYHGNMIRSYFSRSYTNCSLLNKVREKTQKGYGTWAPVHPEICLEEGDTLRGAFLESTGSDP